MLKPLGFIRWMGAFKKAKSIGESLKWETEAMDEKASMAIRKFADIKPLSHCQIGFVFPSESLVAGKEFGYSDVWTVRNAEGKLTPTRCHNSYRHSEKSTHNYSECVVAGKPIGIVIYGKINDLMFDLLKKIDLPIVKIGKIWDFLRETQRRKNL